MGPRTFDRGEGLRRLRSGRFDVIVIGGGLAGAAVALDAAARGLRTAILDSGDWAEDHGLTLTPAPGDGKLHAPWRPGRDDLGGLTRTAPHLVYGLDGGGGAIDAARLTLALVRTATLDYGAVAANRVRLIGIRAHDRAGRRVVGLEELGVPGSRFEVPTSAIVSAPAARPGVLCPIEGAMIDGPPAVAVAAGEACTYRRRAARAIDAVVDSLDDRTTLRVRRRCPTGRLLLRGARGFREVRDRGDGRSVLHYELREHLARRYGGEARVLLAMIERRPVLGDPLVAGLPYLAAEVAYAARYEMATTLTDVVARRLGAWTADQAATVAALDTVARVMVAHAGVDAATLAAEATALRAGADKLAA